MSQMRKKKHKALRILGVSLGGLLIFVAFLAYCSAKWYVDVYGQTGFDSILYTLLADLGGVEASLIYKYVRKALIPAVFASALLCPLLFTTWRKRLMLSISKLRLQLFPVRPLVAGLLTLAISGSFLYRAADITQLTDYVANLWKQTNIYKESYKDPATTEITFPQEKRNLIYIFLESVETTLFSREQGGLADTCIIPELYTLAEENVNFSCTEGTGGLRCGFGGTWTIGAMVTETAGIPLKAPPTVIDGNSYGSDGVFLPGATTLMDVLRDNGYYQALMVGSDAEFGGRSTYFSTHGVNRIYDLYTAREDGLIAPDYKVWWGYEDKHLYQYAQQELTKIAAQEDPFAFYMLTVDTHHIDGYICSDCPDTYDNKYENVYACSSKKVSDFIKWIQAQDFYENTAIVLVGDHPTMGNGYILSLTTPEDEGYLRKVYNCFINSAVQPVKTTNREAFTIDMFPTVLASMGCQIQGERLGLGTNLFGATQTLSEEMGSHNFDTELGKPASYYTTVFYVNKKK